MRVRGRPTDFVMRQLLDGVALEDGPARFDRISQDATDGGDTTFTVVLHEGRNREVRRIWAAVGFEVSRLLRVRYGPIELPRDLRPGGSRVAHAGLTGLLALAVHLPRDV